MDHIACEQFKAKGHCESLSKAYILVEYEQRPASQSHPGLARSICRPAAICLGHTHTDYRRGGDTRAVLDNSRILAH